MNEDLKQYRNLLIGIHQKSQEDYDKAVLTLSGGALGISFAFVKDILGPQPITYTILLLGSWSCWGLGVTCALFSFYFSCLSLRKAIKQVDDETIQKQSPGGYYSLLTNILNILGGILFVFGVCFISVFIYLNLR